MTTTIILLIKLTLTALLLSVVLTLPIILDKYTSDLYDKILGIVWYITGGLFIITMFVLIWTSWV